MSSRNLQWLRGEMQTLLNMQVGDIDQAYNSTVTADDPWALIDSALSEAQEIEVLEAKQETSADIFKMTGSLVWPMSERTLELPQYLLDVELLRVEDITGGVYPGRLLHIYDRNGNVEPELSWLDRKTLQWGTSGPGETKSLMFTYLPYPPEMHNPLDEPDLIPFPYRRLLVWTAGIVIKAKVNESEPPPPEWVRQQLEWRQRFHMALWKGRPRDPNRPAVRTSGGDFGSPRT